MALREEKERYEAVREVIRDEGNLQMYFQSKYEDEKNYTGKKRIMMILGIFLAGIVGLIGISNVVNTVSTDVSARKLEYAAMQSIGMTKRQMEKRHFWKICPLWFFWLPAWQQWAELLLLIFSV